MTGIGEAGCGRSDTSTGSGLPWTARAMRGGWAPSPMGHPGHPGGPRSPVRLGRSHRSPCTAVEPARPTHLSAGSNNRTPVVGWGSFAPPEVVGMSQLICLLTDACPTAASQAHCRAHIDTRAAPHLCPPSHSAREPAVRRWTRGSSWQAAQGWVLRPLCAGDSREKRRSPSTTDECFRS